VQDPYCPSQHEVLEELARRCPGVPMLCLGQTVFWDEPMKAGVLRRIRQLGDDRPFLAGVHDTDYFAKSPKPAAKNAKQYEALPHNDSSTKGLWSAAGEFSTLFGSETVVTRDRLASAGAKLGLLEAERPGTLDEVTEAWGWCGVVGHTGRAETTAETSLDRVWPALWGAFDSMVGIAEAIVGPGASKPAEELRALVCDAAQSSGTLAGLYERLMPQMFEFVAGSRLDITPTRTTALLRLTPDSAALPRFRLLDAFLHPDTAEAASQAYDGSVAGSEIYPLAKFGAGALPFDVLVPGHGRGTLRLGTAGGVVQTPVPVGFRYKRKPESAAELAEVLESRFGPGCVVLGKALVLVPMLAAEHVFVFHQGASEYVHRSATIVRTLREAGVPVPPCHPILRVAYPTWDALQGVSAWFDLPEPLQRPFGAARISACGFATRWRHVAAEQRALIEALGQCRSPVSLLDLLASTLGGSWETQAARFAEQTQVVAHLASRLHGIREAKAAAIARQRHAKAERQAAERKLGEHWRSEVWGRAPSEAALAERARLQRAVESAIQEVRACREEWKALDEEQRAAVEDEAVQAARAHRRTIAIEAEFARARLVQAAVHASDGLERAGRRPSAWWFPLVSPDGAWFRTTTCHATYSIEELG
jgi:hypothetical protein